MKKTFEIIIGFVLILISIVFLFIAEPIYIKYYKPIAGNNINGFGYAMGCFILIVGCFIVGGYNVTKNLED